METKNAFSDVDAMIEKFMNEPLVFDQDADREKEIFRLSHILVERMLITIQTIKDKDGHIMMFKDELLRPVQKLIDDFLIPVSEIFAKHGIEYHE